MIERTRNPREERTEADLERELQKIKEKYKSGPVFDDGKSDSCALAIYKMNYASATGDGKEEAAWLAAIKRASRDEFRNWEHLRAEIKQEGRSFLSIIKANDEESKQIGRALMNLADSI